MITKRILCLSLFCLAFQAPLLAKVQGPAKGGEPAKPVVETFPDKRPEIEKALATLESHVNKKGPGDTDAITVIDGLMQEFVKSGPKDRVAITKGLSKCFESRRLEKVGEPLDNKLYLAAAVALGRMGPESTPVLIAWIGQKDLRKDLKVQHELILSLGKTKDKAAIKTLLLTLENKDAPLVSAGAEAIGEFAAADLDIRKQLFEALLKQLMSAKGAMDGDPNNSTARERYDVIAAPIITSLSKLSKHDERDPQEWLRWWNKNKKGDWEAGG
jgi:hypothetical protein